MAQQDPSYDIIRSSDASQHTCHRPAHKTYMIGKGAIIRCKQCKQQWLCTGENYGDQRDPINPPQLVWVKQ